MDGGDVVARGILTKVRKRHRSRCKNVHFTSIFRISSIVQFTVWRLCISREFEIEILRIRIDNQFLELFSRARSISLL